MFEESALMAMPTYIPARAERTRWPNSDRRWCSSLSRRLLAHRLNAVAIHGESLDGDKSINAHGDGGLGQRRASDVPEWKGRLDFLVRP